MYPGPVSTMLAVHTTIKIIYLCMYIYIYIHFLILVVFCFTFRCFNSDALSGDLWFWCTLLGKWTNRGLCGPEADGSWTWGCRTGGCGGISSNTSSARSELFVEQQTWNPLANANSNCKVIIVLFINHFCDLSIYLYHVIVV